MPKIDFNSADSIKYLGQDVDKVMYKGAELYVPKSDLLLDIYTGAAAAYSLRNLSSTTTNVVRVRRSSDNVEQDFTAAQITDGTLTTFVGAGNDGFVAIIYDQVSSNNMLQTTASRQGILVINGVVNTLNGNPIIQRSVDNDGGYLSTYQPNGVNKSLIFVGYNGLKTACIFGSDTGGPDYGYVVEQNSTSNLVNNIGISIFNERINQSTITYSTRGQFYNLTDTQFLLSTNIDFNFDNNLLAIGYRFNQPSYIGMFEFQEFIIWNNELDTLAIETEINNNYNIY